MALHFRVNSIGRVLPRFFRALSYGSNARFPGINTALRSAIHLLRLAPTQLRPHRFALDHLVQRGDALLVGGLFGLAGADDT